jgi:hypothetical protein
MKLLTLLPALLLTLNGCFAGTAYTDEETKPSNTTGVVKDGKIEVKITRRLLWTGKPAYPVTVSLKAEDGSLFLTQKITEGSTVTLSGAIRRGNFKIYSDIAKDTGYWPAFGGKVAIGADGSISLTPQPIEHQLRMTLLAPKQLEELTAKRPTLKWEPVAGAQSYTITWIELQGKFRKIVNKKEDIAVNASEWTFDTDVVPGRTYEWIVVALDKDGKRFAYYASGYFVTK